MKLEVEQLSGGYGRKIVCRDISFSLTGGQTLCVVGPNGCGKSTLFRLLLHFNPWSSGRVLLDGRDISALTPGQLADIMAYIPQTHSPIFAYSVLELVLMGRVNHFAFYSVPQAVDEKKALECLQRLGIAHLAQENYAELSGGQQQLALIARALAQESQILIMDEPASALDYSNRQLVLHAVADLRQEGYTVILSTHNLDTPFAVADWVLLMDAGRVHSFGAPEATLTRAHLEAVYHTPLDVLEVRDRLGRTRRICLPVSGPAASAAL